MRFDPEANHHLIDAGPTGDVAITLSGDEIAVGEEAAACDIADNFGPEGDAALEVKPF